MSTFSPSVWSECVLSLLPDPQPEPPLPWYGRLRRTLAKRMLALSSWLAWHADDVDYRPPRPPSALETWLQGRGTTVRFPHFTSFTLPEYGNNVADDADSDNLDCLDPE